MASHDWDEKHFDDYYANVFEEAALGFIYNQPGTLLNDKALAAAPHCNTNSAEMRILFGDSKGIEPENNTQGPQKPNIN